MNKYVNVEVLKEQDFQDFSNTDVFNAIDNCPTANVQEVIYCGECKHYNYLEPNRCALCNFILLQPDDFCSYAERRDAE